MALQTMENSSEETDQFGLNSILKLQHEAFRKEPYPSYKVRKDRLKRLSSLVADNQKQIADAIKSDFVCRSEHESRLIEVLASLQSIQYASHKLKKWMSKRHRGTAKWFLPGSNYIMPQPLGVVGVMAPWNYPVNLAVAPAATAIAAGNRVMLRMSEYTPATTNLFDELVKTQFDADEMTVFGGEADLAQSFSSLPFDHLLFTGSTSVGRSVMAAAAKNLTPVTLELGGKSPVIIAEDYPIEEAAQRVGWGKAFNAGQTCIAPDYAFVPAAKLDSFISAFQKFFIKRYGNKDSEFYTSIVNERFHKRLTNLVEDAKSKGAVVHRLEQSETVAPDGQNKFLPCVIVDPPEDALVSQEEIFGPILVVKTYSKLDDVLNYINDGERPLALYPFVKSSNVLNKIMRHTHSGGVAINDVMIHFLQEDLPFGGVGASGFGKYHGPEGFETFSNMKPVFKQRGIGGFTGVKTLYPPYGSLTNFMIRIMGA